MRLPDLTPVVGVLALSGLSMCILVVTASHDATPPAPPVAREGTADARAVPELAKGWAAKGPFRSTRRPAGVRFSAAPMTEPPPPGVAGPRPQLVLRGLVDGRVRVAIVEGFPGTEGARAVRVGDTVGAFRVTRVDHGHVRIAAADTSWRLNLMGMP